MKQLVSTLISFFFILNSYSQACFGPAQRITHIENNNSFLVTSFDVDGDNDIDIVSQEDGNILYWYENTGNEIYENKTEIPIAYSFDILAVSNNNSGDSFIDLFVRESGPTGSLHNLMNNGTGIFTESTTNVPSNGVNLSNKDVTGDNDVDVAVIEQQNPDMNDGVSIWEMSSTGEFENENYIYFPDMLIECLLLTDIDNDIDNDLIVSAICPLTSENYILLKKNDGSGNFGEQDTIATELNSIPRFLSSADIDGDNYMDIISYVEDKIVWYKNNGLGAFESKETIFDFGSNISSYLGAFPTDIDGDNDIDIISNTENNVVYYENTDGNGTFGGENIICTLSYVNSINIVDIDQDGDSDLLVASFDGTYLFENNPEVIITIQPENINAVEGDNVLISLEADGNDLLYQWQLSDVNISNGGNITGADSPVLSINPANLSDAGNYKCHIVGDCNEIYSNEVLLNVASSSISSINNISFNVYPNPTSNVLYISSKSIDEFDVTLSDVMGKIIFADSFSGNQIQTIDLTNISKGIYFIVLNTEESIISKKIILK